MNSISNISSNDKSGEATEVKPVLVAKDFLTIAILLVVIVFLWIGFGVYKNLTKSQVLEPTPGLAKPIKAGFPQEVFDNLRQRSNYRDRDLNESDRVILK